MPRVAVRPTRLGQRQRAERLDDARVRPEDDGYGGPTEERSRSSTIAHADRRRRADVSVLKGNPGKQLHLTFTDTQASTACYDSRVAAMPVSKCGHHARSPETKGHWLLAEQAKSSFAILRETRELDPLRVNLLPDTGERERPASTELSIPIQPRLRRSAVTKVVPLPAKGSSTMSPGSELAVMMRSSSSSGFCVSKPIRSSEWASRRLISVQISCSWTPGASSVYRLSLGTPFVE